MDNYLSKNKSYIDADEVLAVYDLNSQPITFDFAYFLVGAEVFAKQNGKTIKIRAEKGVLLAAGGFVRRSALRWLC